MSKELPGLPTAEKPVAGSNGIKIKPRAMAKGPKTPAKAPKVAWPQEATTTVTLPDAGAKGSNGLVAAKGLPLSVGRTSDAGEAASRMLAQAGPVTVEARILDRAKTQRAGVTGLLFTLAPKAAPGILAAERTSGPVKANLGLRVDYRNVAEAFGGSYASRMRLVQLPSCALTTPDKEACRTEKPIDTVNDTKQHTLTAKSVSLQGSAPAVFAAAAGSSGGKGDYKATSLSASSTWATDLNTGDFTWSYDMEAPEVPGGLKPSVGMSYSSSAIDGRTSSSNNQGSWAGDGFEMWPGYIERRYKPCADEGVKNADGIKPGDRCWAYDNAFISFNGKSGELVPAGNDEFKLKRDDGTRIKRLASAERGNGDNDGEHWRLTAPDGTQYFFGYNRLPGWTDGKETTDSTWTVPVYGNNAGEPCHATAFADSWCQQAWRWNLDYVVDPHGNAIGYHYAKESNSYGRNLKDTDDTLYTRGGYLERIDYGLKSANLYADKPQGQVWFTNAERCLPRTGVTCAENTIDTQAPDWYDTPWDLNCTAGTKCDKGRYSPSFWTRKRLTDVTTQVLKADGTYGKVDSWKLDHRWGMADTDYQLLLDSIQHTGHTATPAITLPKTTLAYTQLENRLDKTGDGYPPYIKARLSSIADESGGQIDANYSAPACTWSALPTPETNTTRCFPQFIGGDGSDAADREWFNKYVVTSVSATDRTGGSPDRVTQYQYLGDAAWHFDDDDGLTKEKEKTWSQWRGYGQVRVQTGGQGGVGAMKTQQDSYFLRGMNGDRKTTSGGTKTVSVPLGEGEGEAISDHEAVAGFGYKTVSFDKPDGKILAKDISRPWYHETAKKVRDWGTVTANLTGASTSKSWTSLDNGAGVRWRTTSKSTKQDTVAGRVTEVTDFGDDTDPADSQCTRTTFATNVETNRLNLPSRVEVVAKGCDAATDRSKDVVSDVRTAYDGGAYGAAPTRGETTATAVLKSHDGSKATYLETGATFDAYGRQLTTTDLTANVTAVGDAAPVRTPRSDGRITTSTYIPATGRPTQTKLTTPPANPQVAATAQTTTTDVDPLRGLVVKQTDTNNGVTTFAFDALGRASKTWLADRSTTQVPNYQYEYNIADGRPVAVATKVLDNKGGQIASYSLLDGFLRERQTQAPGPESGRILADVFYDERGLAAKSFAPYYATGKPSVDIFKPADALAVETQTRTVYDGLNRPVESTQIAGNGDGGKVLGTSRTTYSGDRTTVIPPAGGTATTTLTNAHGKTTELRQHHTRSADAAYDTTKYQYTPRNELSKVTDPAGNSWGYTYDQLGRKVQSVDPDKGTATTVYDDRGQVTSAKGSRTDAPALAYVYDNLGRKTELHEGTTAGPLRAKWVYDTVTGAKGQLAESTRYVGDQAYTSKVTDYDAHYRPVKTAVVIPASEGVLQGTYQTGTAYLPSGLVGGISYSAAGSLAGGSVNYTYDEETLRPISVFGQGITSSTSYSLTGKPLQYGMGLATGGKKSQVTNTYEWGTQRLATSRVDRQDQAGVDRNVTYKYDEAGNVLSMADVSRTGTDNQCFTQDYLGRLTEAWTQNTTTCAATPAADKVGGPAPYWQSFAYDKSGNRATETQHSTTGDPAKDTKRTYSYPLAGKPQAHSLSSVTTTSPTGTKTDAYTYDTAGNTLTRPGQKLTWDAEDRLSKVTEGDKTTEYLYDPDGSRLIGRTATETTLYLGHTEVVLPRGAGKAKATRYIDLGGGQSAVRNDDGSFAFTVSDHHGTGELAIQAADLALSQRRALPFGGSRGEAPKSWPGTKGFVGGTDDSKATGLTHLGAREYDPSLGRFISVDPLLDLADPQQMNGYTYSNNNPATLSDPSGLRPMGACDHGGACNVGSADKPKWETWTPNSNGGWDWGWSSSDTQTYKDKSSGQSYEVTTRVQYRHKSGYSANWVATPKPKPKPPVVFHGWAMGSNPNYDASVTDAWIKRPPLSTFQKVALGVVSALGLAVVAAPVAMAIGPEISAACLFSPAGCAEVAAEIGTGGAAGGSLPSLRPIGGAKAASGCKCFLAGTEVEMADGSTKAIEDIEIGDEVLATDPETGETGPRKVSRLIVTEGDKNFNELSIQTDDGLEKLTATFEHPFWVLSEKRWVEAGQLRPGMTLRTDDGSIVDIRGNRAFDKQARTYNFTVDDLHTYYVLAGETPVLVHNSNCTGTVWDDIEATQPNYAGSDIPKSFVMNAGGSKVWVHPNATEHVAEYAKARADNMASREQVGLSTQAYLKSLQSAAGEATRGSVPLGRTVTVGGWEMKFSQRPTDPLPALMHAFYVG